MRIIGLTDIHGNIDGIYRLMPELKASDLILLAGDITHFGDRREVVPMLSPFESISIPLFAVSGNCDRKGVDKVLDEKGIQLHGFFHQVGTLGIIGLGGSLITPFNTPNEFSEVDYAAVLARLESELPEGMPFIMVSHQPPYDTACDRLGDGRHVGSTEVRKFIEARQPVACLTGHIHESAGLDRIGRTVIVNPGAFGQGGYMLADWDGADLKVSLERLP